MEGTREQPSNPAADSKFSGSHHYRYPTNTLWALVHETIKPTSCDLQALYGHTNSTQHHSVIWYPELFLGDNCSPKSQRWNNSTMMQLKLHSTMLLALDTLESSKLIWGKLKQVLELWSTKKVFCISYAERTRMDCCRLINQLGALHV